MHATNETGTAYASEVPEFTHGFYGGSTFSCLFSFGHGIVYISSNNGFQIKQLLPF